MHFRKYTKNRDNAYQIKYLKACQYALNQPLKSKALIDFITNTAVASSCRLIEKIIQNNRMEEGKLMLQKEIELYPESKVFIDRIFKMLE